MSHWKQRLLYRLLREYMLALRAENKGMAEDAVIDVLDMVSGFCSPHMRLDNLYGKAPH